MIRLSEVRDVLKDINGSFGRGFPQITLRFVLALHKRLTEEVTSSCTEIDLSLIDLRGNLLAYTAEKFSDARSAKAFFDKEIKQKFVKDLRETEIAFIVSIAREIERLP